VTSGFGDVLLQKLKVGQVEVVFVHSPIELRAEEKGLSCLNTIRYIVMSPGKSARWFLTQSSVGDVKAAVLSKPNR